MKKVIIAAAIFAVALVTARRFGPALAQRGMDKCHEMMSKCQETFGQQAGSPADTPCKGTATSGPASGEHEPEEATAAS